MQTIGNRIIHLDETDSTNLHLLRLMEKEVLSEGTVVEAGYQTSGKGAGDACWHSERGRNLLFSVLLFPSFLHPARQFFLNKVLSLAVLDLLREEAVEETAVKWPNDIYIGKKKVAGMLVRNGIRSEHFDYSIAGVGLNVNQEKFPAGLPNPASLINITGRCLDLKELLDRLLVRIDLRYGQLRAGDLQALDKEYASSLFQAGQRAAYRYKGKKIIAAIAGVNDYGFLRLDAEGLGKLECDLKEVEYLL